MAIVAMVFNNLAISGSSLHPFVISSRDLANALLEEKSTENPYAEVSDMKNRVTKKKITLLLAALTNLSN